MKNTFKILFLLFGIIAIMSSCGGGSKSGGGIVGKWEITEAQGSMADMNKGTIYEFTDETNMTLSKGGIVTNATYKLKGDSLQYSFGGGMNMNALVKISGDKMNFEIVGSDQKFVLTKK